MKQLITIILFLIATSYSFAQGPEKKVINVQGTSGSGTSGRYTTNDYGTLVDSATTNLYKIIVDTTVIASQARLSAMLAFKLDITDTANMRFRGIAGYGVLLSGTYPNQTIAADTNATAKLRDDKLNALTDTATDIRSQVNTNTGNIAANTASILLKANIASPTFTGTPLAPSPTFLDSTTKIATTESVHKSSLSLNASRVMTSRYGYMVYPQITTNYETPIEIINIGNTTSPSDSNHYVNTSVQKFNWSFLRTWNMKLDSVTPKWLSPITTKPSYAAELGVEGYTIHAQVAGTNFSDSWHEIFQIRSAGIDVGTGSGGNIGAQAGMVIQNKTTNVWRYKSGTYVNDNDPWYGGTNTAYKPFISLQTEETKGNGNAIELEANHTTGGTGMGIFFKKSSGTNASKTAVSSGHVAGLLVWSPYDGAKYQNTARIYGSVDATPSAGVIPQSLLFQTSNTDSAAIATRMRIWGNGNVSIGTLTATSFLDIAAGSTTVAPLGLNSGSLLTTPLAGKIEFLTDKAYLTITTGAVRKEYTLNDAALTSGRVPFITTNGRLTDVTGFAFNGTSLSLGAANNLVGATTNNDAAAGNIGEEVNSVVSTYTNYTTTATYQNITSITLTAGDWDISAFGSFSINGATITSSANAIFVISTTTASAAGATEGKDIAYVPQAALLGTSIQSIGITPVRVSISGTTPYYLNTQSSFTLGNPQFTGSIRARRLR